jgi:hypothetical protein
MENQTDTNNSSNKFDRKKYMSEYNKKYREANKEKINEKIYKKEVCNICKKSVNHQHMEKHKQSACCQKKKAKIIDLFKDLKQYSLSSGLDPNGLEIYDHFIKKYVI